MVVTPVMTVAPAPMPMMVVMTPAPMPVAMAPAPGPVMMAMAPVMVVAVAPVLHVLQGLGLGLRRQAGGCAERRRLRAGGQGGCNLERAQDGERGQQR